MPSKEEHYQSVLDNRRLLEDPKVTACTCPITRCEWHGRCRECVALHRHYGDHIPACLQPMLREKVKALAGTVEYAVSPTKEKLPAEYYDYVRERDNT